MSLLRSTFSIQCWWRRLWASTGSIRPCLHSWPITH